MISYSFFSHDNELKDYISATIISFSAISFIPIMTVGSSIGYMVFKLYPKQRAKLVLKYLLIYLCFSIPTQLAHGLFNERLGLTIVTSLSITICVLFVEALILIVGSKGKYDCLDYLLGIEYDSLPYISHPWLKGTLSLIPCFVFMVAFSVFADLNNTWQRTIATIKDENTSYGQDIYFEWDRLYGLCNSVFVIKETTQDIYLPSDFESFIRRKDYFVWTIYISCNKYSINNLERRITIAQEIAKSLYLNQFDSNSVPLFYRLRLYYSNYSTPFSKENICYEYFLDPKTHSLSGGVDISAILEYNRLIHKNYSTLIKEVLIKSQSDSLLDRYTSGKAINLTPEIEEGIIHQSITHLGKDAEIISFPILPFSAVMPLKKKTIGISFPRTSIDFVSLTMTSEKEELESYRGKNMPYSFYYLNEMNILSSFRE